MKKLLLPALMLIASAALADWVFINPFPGSKTVTQESKKGQKLSLPEAPVDSSGKPGRSVELEGKVGRLVWKNPKGKSTQELYDSYAQQLSKGGFKPLWACAGKECGAPASVPLLGKVPASADSHYAVAQLVRRDRGDVFAAIQVSPDDTTLLLIEVSATPEQKESVTREAAAAASKFTQPAIADALAKDGHVALGDILYKTGEVALRPEAASVVKTIAAELQKDPGLKLYVVGHTDSQGKYKDNLAVSRKRANWLVKELTKQGVSGKRLQADGVGPLAPVASNETDEGRARNRRVELVKQ
jgi:outer membrane protein OmpA-like peptidoglycan-associated protein